MRFYYTRWYLHGIGPRRIHRQEIGSSIAFGYLALFKKNTRDQTLLTGFPGGTGPNHLMPYACFRISSQCLQIDGEVNHTDTEMCE